jgi:ribonuclease HI
VVLIAPGGEHLCNSLRSEFKTTNNEAEYEVVLAELRLAQEIGAEFVKVQSNSQVIVGHIRGEFKTKGERMKLYLSRVQGMQTSFKKFGIVKILREKNEKAYLLAWIGSVAADDLEKKIDVPIQTLL